MNINANSSISIGTVQGGAGGQGGGANATPSPATAPENATALSAAVQTGNGGKGGSISYGNLTNSGTTQPGPGGTPGDSEAAAQNGGANAAGGNVNIKCGNQGLNGTPGTPWSNGVTPGSTYLSCAAGNGGSADNNSVPGGNGGSCVVTDLNGSPITIPSFTITVSCGKGGKGYSGSCTVAGAGKATNGGLGGNVNTKGVAYTLKVTGDGGDGGSGEPNGTGGAAGTDLISTKPIGKKGVDGTPCHPQGPTISKTVSLPTSEISYLCYDPGTGLVFGISQGGGDTIYYYNPETDQVGSFTISETIPGAANGLCTNGATTRSGRTKRGTSLLYAASSVSNAVIVINETTGSQVGTIPMVGGSNGPSALAFDATSGRLYAGAGNAVEVFDTTNNNKLIGTITVTGTPYAFAVNASSNRLYVSDILKDFDVVDTQQMSQVATQVLPDVAYTLAVNPNNGAVFATQFYTAGVLVIDPTSNSVTKTLSVGTSPWGIEVDSQRNRLYVANYNYSSSNQQPGSLTEIDTNSYQTLSTTQLGLGPTNLVVNEGTDQIFVADALDSALVVLNGN